MTARLRMRRDPGAPATAPYLIFWQGIRIWKVEARDEDHALELAAAATGRPLAELKAQGPKSLAIAKASEAAE